MSKENTVNASADRVARIAADAHGQILASQHCHPGEFSGVVLLAIQVLIKDVLHESGIVSNAAILDGFAGFRKTDTL